MTHTRYYSKG
uniref:Uncharacterized protein n=1 Tax=Anguilla anguilla TaxID=7936 RepID=A0A0E9XWM8_ANGAN